MIKAVLFDMDDTLLDINLMAFMATYVGETSRVLSRISGVPALKVSAAYVRGYAACASTRRADGLTNGELSRRELTRLTGIPADEPAIRDALAFYDAEVLPGRNGRAIAARPMPGGVEALARVQDLGLRCALATNPSFTPECIATRMGWARIKDFPFERVSHMDNSTRLKPAARYYEEFVAALGLRPDECLMVGNDARRDFPWPDVSLRTAYVGHARPRRAVWHGSMAELACELPAIVDRLNVGDATRG